MYFSTVLVASAALLGLSCATPEHRYQRRQALTNSSTIASSTTSSSLVGTGSSTVLPSTVLPSTTVSSSVPLSTVALPSFVLAVEIPSNASLAKRQSVIAGYVSLNAADDLSVAAFAQASVFSSVGGELTVGGLTVFASAAVVAAPGYALLAAEAVPTITTDIITTFGISGAGALVWANAAFPDGDAVFFVLGGLVYASFTGTVPAGATVVTLVPVTPGSVPTGPTTSISVTVSVSITINIFITCNSAGALVTSTKTITNTVYEACSSTTVPGGAWSTTTFVIPSTSAASTGSTVTKTVTALGAGVTTTVSGGSTVVVAAASVTAGAAGAGAGAGKTTTAAAGEATATKPAVYTGAASNNVAGSLALVGAGLAFLL